MGRKVRDSKEVKIKACKAYEKGDVSFNDIAKKIRIAREVLHRWYLKYKEQGSNVFEILNKECLYSKQFKLSIIEEYTLDKCLQAGLATKHNITTGLVNGINSRECK